MPLLRRESEQVGRRVFLQRALAGAAAPFVLGGCVDCDGHRTASTTKTRALPHGTMLSPSRALGHTLRDLTGEKAEPARAALHDRFNARPTKEVPIAIVGGGVAGLTAAWALHRAGARNVHLFELEPHLSGTAHAGTDTLTRYPWGAHYLPMPSGDNAPLIELLEEMGLLEGRDADGDPLGAEHVLVREPSERLFVQGYWYRDLYPHALASSEDLKQREKFEQLVAHYVGLRGDDGRRAFTLPSGACSQDPAILKLDEITAEAFLSAKGLDSAPLRFYLDYACRDDYGLKLEETSAWALLFYFCARVPRPGAPARPLLAWPEGNAALTEHMAAQLPSHFALARNRAAWAVHSLADGRVRVRLLDASGAPAETIIAEDVIMATPRFITRRVVTALREDDARLRQETEAFHYGAWLVANVHLQTRLGSEGAEAAWDNVLLHSEGLGYVDATHQSGRDHGPTVITYYLPLCGEASAQRKFLEALTLREAQALVLDDLEKAHPHIARHVSRLDVMSWGHAMTQPRPGDRTHPARRAALTPVGRVHFAHSDLSALALFEEAFDHGLRAAREVISDRAEREA